MAGDTEWQRQRPKMSQSTSPVIATAAMTRLALTTSWARRDRSMILGRAAGSRPA